MLFPTITFAIFFAIVLPLNWVFAPRPRQWRVFILIASYIFYGWWSAPFVLLLAGVSLWSQAMVLVIDRTTTQRARKIALAVAVAGDLGALAYFKYTDFFLSSGLDVLGHFGVAVQLHAAGDHAAGRGSRSSPSRRLTYVVDIYRRQMRPGGLAGRAVYISFFPHLVAGPDRARRRSSCRRSRSRLDPRRIARGPRLHPDPGRPVQEGGARRAALATPIVDPVFASARAALGASRRCSAMYAYAVQIYCDFSGYTDIAIGIALLLGIRFPQNFDAPVHAPTSLQDFWRRWHMTLSRLAARLPVHPAGRQPQAAPRAPTST